MRIHVYEIACMYVHLIELKTKMESGGIWSALPSVVSQIRALEAAFSQWACVKSDTTLRFLLTLQMAIVKDILRILGVWG